MTPSHSSSTERIIQIHSAVLLVVTIRRASKCFTSLMRNGRNVVAPTTNDDGASSASASSPFFPTTRLDPGEAKIKARRRRLLFLLPLGVGAVLVVVEGSRASTTVTEALRTRVTAWKPNTWWIRGGQRVVRESCHEEAE